MKSGTLRNLLIWLCVLAMWETAYKTIGWRSYVFPAPSHLFNSLLELLADGSLFGGVGVSSLRLLIAFVISVAAGAVFGVLMWSIKWIDELLGSMFVGLQTIPSVCWVPLAILTFRISESAILFVTIMGSVFGIAVAFRDGLRSIPPIYRRAGQMLGAGRLALLLHVMAPASLPVFASTLRQGFGFAWRSLLGGELLIYVSNKGLGYYLHTGREFGDIAQVVIIMLAMVCIGITVDRIGFAPLERTVHRRFGVIS
jgi:NitT/TauT family transport system permease protein